MEKAKLTSRDVRRVQCPKCHETRRHCRTVRDFRVSERCATAHRERFDAARAACAALALGWFI